MNQKSMQAIISSQIRRMVGLMVGYAKEEYSLEFLKKVLSGQSLSHDDILTLHRPYATFSMPPQGLFLKNVELDTESKNFLKDVLITM